MPENDKGFTVNDRRMFNVDGSDNDTSVESEKQSEPAPLRQEPDAQKKQDCKAELDSGAYRNLPPVGFGTFVISLAHAAMLHMGHLEDPHGNPVERNLELARHTIDTLAMLKEKTAGNLDQEEDALLTGVLTELRMLYVQTCKSC